MTGTTHRLGGLAAGAAVIYITRQNGMLAEAAIMSGALIGSLMPDIDNPRSTASMRWPLLRMAVGAGQMLVRGIACFLPGKLQKRVRSLAGHRGIIHAPLTAVLLSALVFAAGSGLHSVSVKWMAAGLLCGWCSHIVLDMFSGGAPLGMPFTTGRVTLARIKTGGIAEQILRGAALLLLFGGIRKMTGF